MENFSRKESSFFCFNFKNLSFHFAYDTRLDQTVTKQFIPKKNMISNNYLSFLFVILITYFSLIIPISIASNIKRFSSQSSTPGKYIMVTNGQQQLPFQTQQQAPELIPVTQTSIDSNERAASFMVDPLIIIGILFLP